MSIKILTEDTTEKTILIEIEKETWIIPNTDVEKILNQLLKWKQKYWSKDC